MPPGTVFHQYDVAVGRCVAPPSFKIFLRKTLAFKFAFVDAAHIIPFCATEGSNGRIRYVLAAAVKKGSEGKRWSMGRLMASPRKVANSYEARREDGLQSV